MPSRPSGSSSGATQPLVRPSVSGDTTSGLVPDAGALDGGDLDAGLDAGDAGDAAAPLSVPAGMVLIAGQVDGGGPAPFFLDVLEVSAASYSVLR